MKEKLLFIKFTLVMAILLSSAGINAVDPVNGVDDLNQEGIIITFQSGTTSDLYQAENLKKATPLAQESFDLVIEALINEDAHFALADFPVLSFYAAENAGFEVIDSFSPEDFGIAVRQDSNELLDALNVAITAIIDSGAYDTAYGNWFDGAVVLTDDSDANTATTYPTATTGSTLDNIITAGEIIFGSDTTYAPFEYLDTDGTTVIGFDADIAAAIATELSTAYSTTITATMFTTAWDPIIPDLIASKFDAILSAMTKTLERAQQVDFTRAYYTSAQGVLKGPKALPSDEDDTPLPILPFLVSFMVVALIVKRKRN